MDPDPTRHAAHRLKHLALAEPCHAKWCIDPSGLINRFPLSWNLHWLELEQHQKSIVLTFYRIELVMLSIISSKGFPCCCAVMASSGIAAAPLQVGKVAASPLLP